ncbi:phage capsid protein [Corynebacterium sp. TAE3-ERU16]|uniref:phage capsid protein n=1 Tax=Corynebacterium sp. TAE3-ERU16 TaxID=2849493 RepID=UPI001C43A95A|nr:phage capsid protein [Corynebacterium sp. TAE3-ERU16]MBV7292369.1 hypothetical protein [Corynebacterium sp. TAE3-ERU16]
MAITTSTVTGFRPEIWAAAIMDPFEKASVFADKLTANREYLGEIQRQGDTVHVSSIGTPTIKPYDANQDIEIEDLTVTDNAYKIDQGEYFAFRVEDVTALQAAGPLKDPATKKAAMALSMSVDSFIGKLIKDNAKKKIGATKIVNDDPATAGAGQITAYKALNQLDLALNTESVTREGRFVVVGPQTYSALLMDPRFTRVDGSGTSEGLRNGIVGRATGFDVLLSNNLPKGTGQNEVLCAGVAGGFSFAAQINKVETMREEKRFADLVKGLMIFGGKVFYPEAFATLEAKVEDPAAGA